MIRKPSDWLHLSEVNGLNLQGTENWYLNNGIKNKETSPKDSSKAKKIVKIILYKI